MGKAMLGFEAIVTRCCDCAPCESQSSARKKLPRQRHCADKCICIQLYAKSVVSNV